MVGEGGAKERYKMRTGSQSGRIARDRRGEAPPAFAWTFGPCRILTNGMESVKATKMMTGLEGVIYERRLAA